MLQQFDTCRHCDSVQPSTGEMDFQCRWCGFVNKPKGDGGIFFVVLVIALLLLVGGLLEMAMGSPPQDYPADIQATR